MQEHTLSLGEREFAMRLDMTAVRDLMDHAGVDLLSGGKSAQEAMRDTRNIGTVLWCLCGAEDTGLTAREFGRLIPVEDLPAAMEAVRGMFTRDLPDAKESASAGKPEPA